MRARDYKLAAYMVRDLACAKAKAFRSARKHAKQLRRRVQAPCFVATVSAIQLAFRTVRGNWLLQQWRMLLPLMRSAKREAESAAIKVQAALRGWHARRLVYKMHVSAALTKYVTCPKLMSMVATMLFSGAVSTTKVLRLKGAGPNDEVEDKHRCESLVTHPGQSPAQQMGLADQMHTRRGPVAGAGGSSEVWPMQL